MCFGGGVPQKMPSGVVLKNSPFLTVRVDMVPRSRAFHVEVQVTKQHKNRDLGAGCFLS